METLSMYMYVCVCMAHYYGVLFFLGGIRGRTVLFKLIIAAGT